MFRLISISTSPPAFEPVVFQEGLNVVMGETWDENAATGRKTNGVGKSLFIDFLHFGLLRAADKTRVTRIPSKVLPKETVVDLTIEIHGEEIKISRSLDSPSTPSVTRGGKTQVFSKVDEVLNLLESLFFDPNSEYQLPSFRQLFSLLMRDEKSEFADVLKPHKQVTGMAPELRPHLYLLGIDPEAYVDLRKAIEDLDVQKKAVKALRDDLTQRGQVKLADIPARLNREKDRVSKISKAVEELQTEPVYADLEEEIITLEEDLRKLRAERKGMAHKIRQIESLPPAERIDQKDIAIVYNKVKAGLGDLVEKSLEQAITFKKQIEQFQQSLISEEKSKLKEQHSDLSDTIRSKSEAYGAILRKLDRKGTLQELKTGLEEAITQRDQYRGQEALHESYKKADLKKKNLEADREVKLTALNNLLAQHDDLTKSLNETFVLIHQEVMQTAEASLTIDVSNTKTRKYPVEINLTVKDSGSHGVDHMKVFIYDCTLLFNERTAKQHPGFLLHDNIFETDRDSCVRALNFLSQQEKNGIRFQYVVTLNRDKLEADEDQNLLDFGLDDAKILTLTKVKPLLSQSYQQTN